MRMCETEALTSWPAVTLEQASALAEDVTTCWTGRMRCSTGSYLHNVSVREWARETERGHLQTTKQLYASALPNHYGWQLEIFDTWKWLSGKLCWISLFQFLHGPMSLLSKDWFACDVNLYKYLCHSHNGFRAHNTATLRNYLSRKTQRDTFYQWKWILYIVVDSKPAENLIWDVLLFLIAQHWELFQALSKLSEKKTQARWPEEENQGSQSVTPGNEGKLALTCKWGHGKASGYFTAWKVTIKVDVKTYSHSIYIEISFFYISRRKSAKLIMHVFCSFHCAACRACDAWALVFAPCCGKQNATLIADAFQATHNTLVRLTWPPSFSATKFSCGDCQHT